MSYIGFFGSLRSEDGYTGHSKTLCQGVLIPDTFRDLSSSLTRKRTRCSVLNNTRRGWYPGYVLHPRIDAGANVSNRVISRQILVIVAPTVARSERRWI